MSETPIRSQFVDGLRRLDAAGTRARLVQVRQAVHARIDELRDPELRHALTLVSDDVDRLLRDTSRHAVERLAAGLATSHGEPPPPSSLPRVPTRRSQP